jgi:hypothetical protein
VGALCEVGNAGGDESFGGIRNDELITVGSLNSIGSPFGSDPHPVVQKAAEAAIVTMQGAS